MITVVFLFALFISGVVTDKTVTIYGFINEYQKVETKVEVFLQYSNIIDFIRLNEKGEFKYRTILGNMTLYLCFSLKCDAECFIFKEATSKYYERIEFDSSNRCTNSNITPYYKINDFEMCDLIEEKKEIEIFTEIVEEKNEELIGPKDIVIFVELLFIFNVIMYNIYHEEKKVDKQVIFVPFQPNHPLLLDGYVYSDVRIEINHIFNEDDY